MEGLLSTQYFSTFQWKIWKVNLVKVVVLEILLQYQLSSITTFFYGFLVKEAFIKHIFLVIIFITKKQDSQQHYIIIRNNCATIYHVSSSVTAQYRKCPKCNIRHFGFDCYRGEAYGTYIQYILMFKFLVALNILVVKILAFLVFVDDKLTLVMFATLELLTL